VTSRQGLLEQLSELAGATVTLSEDGRSLTISSADAVRRELAKAALTEMLSKGRTSEKDVMRVIERQEQRFEKSIWDAGVAAARKAGVGRLPEAVIQTFGRLNYRYSYGQNQLAHAVETAHLAAMLARELRADVDIARAGGLLHDLGKAIGREVEGTHAALGAKLAAESGMDERIVHCIEAHHEEIEPSTTEALITIVADAMSGARPGARRESMENYLARLQALEAVAMAFPGVDKCYAIQAGRELRVIVNPHTVDDPASARMAQAISDKIQETLDYPGQIKVMVIREVTSVEHARVS
jgi:ribonuclease Y